MVSRRLAAVALTLLVAFAGVPGPNATAVEGATEITINGGGWGHGIGMPQYAARGMAEDGYGHEEILEYFYTGADVTDIAATNGAGLPDTIRVGTHLVAGTQVRPFLWLDFAAVGGAVEICLPGESPGSCSFTMTPGETWRVTWDESAVQCRISQNGSTVHSSSECGYRLEWGNQPDTRVSVPEVGRVFARGAIEFVGPVVFNQRGFHFVVEVSLEEYLYGLAEVPVSWPAETLAAQVVAARTFAAETTRRRLISYSGNGGVRPDCSCHLVWSTYDQSYKGWHTLSEGNATYGAAWRTAVDSTAGRVVIHPAGSGLMAETYYHSSTGGATENVWDMWGSNPVKYSYLASVPDPWSERYAGQASTIRWSKKMSAGSIAAALGFDEVSSMEIVSRFDSGSPSNVEVRGRIAGSPTTRSYTGGQLKTALGLTSHHIHSIQGFGAPERLAGADRYATAASISQHTHPSGAATVYVAVGTNYPDALAAGPAASADGAPILLASVDGLPPVTRQELQRLAPDRVVVLGGEAALGPAVSSAIAAAVPNATVVRYAGPTRYETAVEVSKATFEPGVSTVYVATGQSFPDALIAAPAATLAGGPTLLVHRDGIPAAVATELQRLQPARIVVVGGTDSVSNAVVSSLGGYAPQVERVTGSNRHALSVAMSQAAFPTAATVYIAVDDRFPDALAAGPLTASSPGPLLLVGTNVIPSVVASELARLAPTRIVILGGPAAVSTSVEEQLATYLR